MFDKTALINCPMWDIEFPPYNIAFLSAILKQHGFNADCFDINKDFYRLILDDQYLWALPDIYSFWQSQDKIKNLFEKRKTIINNFIKQLGPYGIIGFTLQSLNFTFSIELAKIIKKIYPEKIILAGGPECFQHSNLEYIIQSGYFDAVCYQEAEISLPEILSKIKKNQQWDTPGFFIKKDNCYIDCGRQESAKNLDEYPFADYNFLDINTDKLSISTSRGCINNCCFCHERIHWNIYRFRSAESVAEELVLSKEHFPLLKFVYFNDSLINGTIKIFENFCDLMIKKRTGINWGGHTLIREELTGDLLHKMKEAGAQRLNFGVESGSDIILKLMRKSFSSGLALSILEKIKKAGISFSVNLIIGYPGETEEEFNKTLVFFKQINQLTDCIHLNPCYVIKGSGLYNNHDRWGIVLPDNYVTGWYLKDGSNTQEIRAKRINILKGAYKKTSFGNNL